MTKQLVPARTATVGGAVSSAERHPEEGATEVGGIEDRGQEGIWASDGTSGSLCVGCSLPHGAIGGLCGPGLCTNKVGYAPAGHRAGSED